MTQHSKDGHLTNARIAKKQDVSENLFKIWLRPGIPIAFKPGQYATIGRDGIERPYSIASAPYEEMIELFIEYVPPERGGHLTPVLETLPVGDSVSMRPSAKGHFLMQEKYRHHLMVATVTGIAPFVSIVRSALHLKIEGHRFLVMNGASYQDEFGYDAEFERFSREHPGTVTYLPTVSRPESGRNRSWRGEVGRVNALVEKYLQHWNLPRPDTLVYLCGHPGMIADVKERLAPEQWQVASERFWKTPEG